MTDSQHTPGRPAPRFRRATIVALASVAAVLLALVMVAAFALSADAPTGGGRTPDAASRTSATAAGECADPTVTVSTARQLSKALSRAKAGTSIRLEPGTYDGRFRATGAGTAERPISLCGPRDAVLDGGSTSKGYVLHLRGTEHWIVSGFSVRNGQKGVMADGAKNTLIHSLSVSEIGDEAIHLRRFSTDNTVSGNVIRETGLRKAKFGEGVYVGTAESNWCSITDCEPDASDRNVIEGNDIAETTSESVDLKEGTSDGVLRGNTFDGSAITGADSWVDVKGNGWIIEGNSGVNAPEDGFQTHEIVDGWGTDNVFRSNDADVNGPGYGYSITPERDNRVECNNSASGAGEGTTNVDCVR